MCDSVRGIGPLALGHQVRRLGVRRREQQVDAAVMGDHQLPEQVRVEIRLGDGVHDRRRVEPEVHEDAHVAELEVGVDQRPRCA